MPRRFAHRWFRIDLYAALERLKTYLAHRSTRNRSEAGKPIFARPELVPLDLRNPPSESIGSVMLPLAVTAAGVSAGIYLVAALAQADERASERVSGEVEEGEGKPDGPAPVPEWNSAPIFVMPDGWNGSEYRPESNSTEIVSIEGGSGGNSSKDPGTETPEIEIPAGDRSLGFGSENDEASGAVGGSGAGSDSSAGSTDLSADISTGATSFGDFGSSPGLFSSSNTGYSQAVLGSTGHTGEYLALPGPAGGPNSLHSPPTTPFTSRPSFLGDLADQPLRFVSNDGQWDSAVDFSAQAKGYQVWFSNGDAVISLSQPGTNTDAIPAAYAALSSSASPGSLASSVIRMSWDGINPDATVEGEGRLGSVSHYLTGNDPSAWRTNISEYSGIRYRDAWDGIDLVYYQASGGGLEYDLVVAPGVAPTIPAFRTEGATARLQGRKLILTTPDGAELVQKAPVIYQVAENGTRQTVSGHYDLRDDGSIGFTVGRYDPSRELIIDPVLSYSVTLGGSGYDAYARLPSSGGVILAGYSESTNFPVTTGAYDTTYNGGTNDAFVTKYDDAGNVVWSTYLGGTGFDFVGGVAVNQAGDVYITGTAGSNDFPVTIGSPIGGGAFVAKLSADGSTLDFARLVGGGDSYGTGITLDSLTGETVIVGMAAFTNIPVTVDAFQGSKATGYDAFLLRLSGDATTVNYGTFLGGSGHDYATGVVIDSAGDVIISGYTGSTDFPIIQGYDSSQAGGGNDAFVARFGADGKLKQSTYYGGSGDDQAGAVAVDDRDRIYIAGTTTSTDLPTVKPVQATYGGGSSDGFMVKFDSLAAAPAVATYRGGSGTDSGKGIAVDSAGRAVMVGAYNIGKVWVTRYTPDGTGVNWSDNSATGVGEWVAVDQNGNIYATAYTGADVLLLKFGPPPAPVITGISDDTGALNNDRVTTDTTPTLTGTAPASSTVTVYRRGPNDPAPVAVGTTTASGGGLWTFTYGSALPDGPYTLTATATVTGETSKPSLPFTASIDSTAPLVSVVLAGQTYDTRPPIIVVAKDLIGFPSTTTVTLDADLNNDGDFADAGETGFASAALVNGMAQFTTYSYLTTGAVTWFQARITDLAGNEGVSLPKGVLVLASGGGGPSAPSITGMTTDTGASSSDHVTSDTTPTLSGTAAANSTVTIFRQGSFDVDPVEVGRSTASVGGLWTFTYSSTPALDDGVYVFMSVATSGGGTSTTSPPFVVTIDATAPTLNLQVDVQTHDLHPPVTVFASDLGGFPASVTVTLDVDKNNDGDFADAGETGYATAAIINGVAQFSGIATLTADTTVRVKARITDVAGNTGASAPMTVEILSRPPFPTSSRLVNTTTALTQTEPSVAMDAEGDFVVAWAGWGVAGYTYYEGGSGSGGEYVPQYQSGIWAQRYAPDGSPEGSEFHVSTHVPSITPLSVGFGVGYLQRPSVAMDADGDFVIAWMSYAQDGSHMGVYAQRFASNGTPQGSEFRVNENTTNTNTWPSVAMDATGDFVVAWTTYYPVMDGLPPRVHARRYAADGTPQGSEFRVNTDSTSSQTFPSVAMDAAGDFVIAMQGSFQVGSGSGSYSPPGGIFAKRYSADGSPTGDEFRVTTDTTHGASMPDVAMDVAGDFVITWECPYHIDGSGGVYARRFGADSTPLGSPFRVSTNTNNAGFPSVAIDTAGDFIVVWRKDFGPSGRLDAQRFGADGTALGTPFSIDTSYNAYLSTAAMGSDGHFIVVWGDWIFGTSEIYMSGGPLLDPPEIESAAEDTGSSSSDGITSDTTPTLSGTAPANSIVTLYRRGPSDTVPVVDGVTTASSAGLWTFTYSSELADAGYVYTATASSSSGITSSSSLPFQWIVDSTPPIVHVTAVRETSDSAIPITVNASDLIGFPSLVTISLDVDLNDDGDFTDSGETSFGTADLTNGSAVFTFNTWLAAGTTVRFRARVSDLAGNGGFSPVSTLEILTPPWNPIDINRHNRSGYGGLPGWTTSADSLIAVGDVTAAQVLDLDFSPTPARGSNPYLSYHSQEASPSPVVQAVIPSSNALGLPSHVYGTLTWDGVVVGGVDYNLSQLSPGGNWLFSYAPSGVQSTGRHTYSLDLFIDYAGTVNDVTTAVRDATYVVNRSTSPYGAGWAFSDTDTLVTITASGPYPAGVLRQFGTGGWAFYADSGGGQYTEPAGDAGNLVLSGGTWTYTSWDGEVEKFDSSGRMTSWTASNTVETVTYMYDVNGNLGVVLSPDGETGFFSYSTGLLETVSTSSGLVTTFSYTGSDLSQTIDPSGGAHTFAYSAHRLTGETHGAGRVAYSYDGTGLAQTVKLGNDPVGTITAALGAGILAGASTEVRKAAPGSFIDARGAVTRQWVNAFGQPVRVAAPDGGLRTYGRDPNGWVTGTTETVRHASQTDAGEIRVTNYTVNAAGQVLREDRADGTYATWDYSGANHSLTGHRDYRGKQWAYTNDGVGQRLTETDPLNHTTTYTWANGLLSMVKDATDLVTTYQYDAFRRLLRTFVGGQPTGTNLYDQYGFVGGFTDARGNTTTIGNDRVGNPIIVLDALMNWSNSDHDAAGRLLWTSDQLGNITSYAYDAAGRMAETIEAYGTSLARRTTYAYDVVGNLESTLDPLGRRTTMIRDILGRVVETVDPLGNRTRTGYDLAGQATVTQDALGRMTAYRYDQLGRPASVIDALGGIATTEYDGNSNIRASVDPLGNRSVYEYDAAGRLSRTIDPLGRIVINTYDDADRLESTTLVMANPSANQTTTYLYDNQGRLAYVIDAEEKQTEYRYDAASNLVEVVDPNYHTTTTVYDALSRPESTIDPEGNRTTIVYDSAGNVHATVDPFNKRTTLQYDALNRQEAVIDPLNKRATTVYDAGDRVAATIDPRGNQTAYVYDALDRVVHVTDARGYKTFSQYDTVGNLTSSQDALGRTTTVAYDALNRPAIVTDPLGNVTTTAYDAASRVRSIEDPLGNLTSYGYDAAGQLRTLIEAEGSSLERTTTYDYDNAGNQVSTLDPLGNLWTSTYDRLNRPTGTQDPLGNTTATVYDAAGNVSYTLDARGKRTTFHYDNANKLTLTEDAAGKLWTTTYDKTRVRAIENPLNAITSYSYDAAGRVLVTIEGYGTTLALQTVNTYDDAGNLRTVTDPWGNVTTYGYDARNQQTTITDALGKVWTTQYDALGRAWRTIDPLGHDQRTYFDAAGRTAETADGLLFRRGTEYDAAGNVTATIDPVGNRTSFIYDELNQLEVTIDADAKRTTTAYDDAGRVLSVTNPRGSVTSYAYDVAGRMTAKLEAFGTTIQRETTYEYDANGNLRFETDALNRTTEHGYDNLNHRTSMIDPLNNLWLFGYDAVGNLKEITDPLGHTVTTVYDKLGRVIATVDGMGNRTTTVYDNTAGRKQITIDPRNNTTTAVYDALNRVHVVIDALTKRTTTIYDDAGQVKEIKDQLGKTTTYLYDPRGLQIAVIDRAGNRSTTVYDPAGRVQATVDPLGERTTYGYDALNRRVLTIDARNESVIESYDAAGNRTRLIDQELNITTWTYDALNQVTAEQNVSGTVTYAYDAAGQLRSETDRLGRRRDFTYDLTGHKATEAWLTAGATIQLQTWTYDDAGRLETARDPDGTYTYAYDNANRVTRIDEPFGLWLTFAYDAAGNRKGITDSKGGVTTLTFNALNRQSSEQVGGSGVSPMRFDYEYTARGQVESLTRYSNLAGTAVVGTTVYDYDDAARLRNLKHKDASGSILANYTSTYDAASRLATKVENGTTTVYDYDKTGQLTQDGTATYGYDGAGNRTNTGYVTDPGNRMRNDGSLTYTYDAEGNLTQRAQGAGGELWLYTYDHRNQLVSVEYKPTGTSTSKLVTYSYDAWGNLIQRQMWDGSTTTTSRYGLDGWDPAKGAATGTENFDAWVDLDGSNALTMRRAFGTGFDEVVARQNAAGTVAWYQADRQGSVRQVIDNSATILATAVYSAFGDLTSGSVSDRYAHTGQELDPDTGLVNYNARWYLASVGRFMSEDPKGFAAGDANLYRYVGNSPTNATDPSGQKLFILSTDEEAFEKASDGTIVAFPAGNGFSRLAVSNEARNEKAHAQIVRFMQSAGYDNTGIKEALNALYEGDISKPLSGYNSNDDRLALSSKLSELYPKPFSLPADIPGSGVLPSTSHHLVLANANAIVQSYWLTPPPVAPRATIRAVYSTEEEALMAEMKGYYDSGNYSRYIQKGSQILYESTLYSLGGVAGVGGGGAVRGRNGTNALGTRELMREWQIGGLSSPQDRAAARLGSLRLPPIGSSGSSLALGRNLTTALNEPRLDPVSMELILRVIKTPPEKLSAFELRAFRDVAYKGVDLSPSVLRELEVLNNPPCFAAGTPLLTPHGAKFIEEIQIGDLVLARKDDDPRGIVEPKVVEEVFVRSGLVLNLHIGREVIRTTGGHPFYVHDRGWVACMELAVGDQLLCADGTHVRVDDVCDTEEWELVYNLRVADFHTYFVGCDEWGFSVWAHNACGVEVLDRAGRTYRVPHGFKTYEEYHNFVVTLDSKLVKLDPAAKGFMQGSAVTGVKYEPPHPAFDVGRTSDFDIAIVSPEMIARAERSGVKVKNAGFGGGKYTQPLDTPELVEAMGLADTQKLMSEIAGRKVNFMVFEKPTAVYKNPTMPIENLK